MYQKLKLLIHTLKYLKGKQLYYQLYYRVKNRFVDKLADKSLPINESVLVWKTFIKQQDSFNAKEGSFTFLNLEKTFDSIDWNYAGFGKLWTYNLNYFDFLNQATITKQQGLFLIEDYIKNDASLKDGLEPYPISLRGTNWIKFLSENKIGNQKIDQVLYNHYSCLYNNLEYHLLGNHLLENGFSLLFGAYYFQDEKLYQKADKIIRAELKEQILNDGAHFELSPMYHQIILFRLLDSIQLLQLNSWKNNELLLFLNEKAGKMLGWLEVITYKNGGIPMVNDTAYGITPSTKELVNYANNLAIEWTKGILKDSGYRKFTTEQLECFIDVGNIGPDYIPGHAHADTFNFELYVKGKPFIVDIGTSTYEKNEQRQLERSTSSHNTVVVKGINSSEVWGGFRVANRAKITELVENKHEIIAAHNGYKYIGVTHQRSFKLLKDSIIIEDEIFGKATESIAYFHLHPSIEKITTTKNTIVIAELDCEIKFFSESFSIEQSMYDYAVGFNKTKPGILIKVPFKEKLTTTFLIS